MSAPTQSVDIKFPPLPAKHDEFLQYVKDHPDTPMAELLQPYKEYDAELRKAFAQQPDHPAVKQPTVIPVFAGLEKDVRIRARNLSAESKEETERYIMPLKDEHRRPDGLLAIVHSLQDFQTRFNVFSESSLVDLDWSNVVVAGSAVVSSLLEVPKQHRKSKGTLRKYYHELLAPASDVDLFLYGLTEEQASDKIQQIEHSVRDALLVESTTIRTKHTITIASRHPVRHVQIVLRLYKSVSEILTGFDVDCSCAVYDGSQVYASPRAIGAYMTQVNTIDLTRRSPSYEMRLSKYAQRGFEIYWPILDRSRIDPTIFERSFARTEGLARLLILEKLPKSQNREAYQDQRRKERGRPAINRWRMRRRQLHGNFKNDHEDEVAEWAEGDLSNYHTITIPYGPKFHARKIEKLLFTRDMVLNADWNKQDDREVNLHRHPAFFGRYKDIIHDCCGYCPTPTTAEEEEVYKEESKTFISGKIEFIKDDPGRQEIGSFNPITDDDWTEMGYVGNTARLCQAIVEGDLDYVKAWLQQEGNNPNTRDYTGRAPLHLAVATSTPEVVQALIDHGARLVARLADGRTALHLAALRGSVDMVSALLRKSEANEEEEDRKVNARRAARRASEEGISGDLKTSAGGQAGANSASVEEDSDIEIIEEADVRTDVDATSLSSIVDIKGLRTQSAVQKSDDIGLVKDIKDDEPDVYDVNVVAWDTAVSALHLAIVKGHSDVVKCLVEEFGADVLLPVKLCHEHDKSARAAILTLVLALQLPLEQAETMSRMLFKLGASSSQASIDQSTALQFCVAERPDLLATFADTDATGVNRAINHLSVAGLGSQMYSSSLGSQMDFSSPLMTAIKAKDSLTAVKLLTTGAKPEIEFTAYMKAWQTCCDTPKDSKKNRQGFEHKQRQPVVSAIAFELPLLAKALVEEHGVGANTLAPEGFQVINASEYFGSYTKGKTILDLVREKLKALRAWEGDTTEELKAPGSLLDDAEYLSKFDRNTYAFWSVQKQLDRAKAVYEEDLKYYQERLEESKDRTGFAEKKQAIQEMATDFEQLESALVERGAKQFYELYPHYQQPEEPYKPHYRHFLAAPRQPFSVDLKFHIGNLTDESQDRYERLFEAAWTGNVAVVKTLTLTPWTDAEGDQQAPCTVAVQDYYHLCPFSISVLRGHLDLARVIMDIAQIQYFSPDRPKKRRYILDGGDGHNDEHSGDEEEVLLFSEIVDDQFTIENIGEVSMQVRSSVKPESLVLRSCPADDFVTTSTDSNDGFSYSGPRHSPPSINRTNTGSVNVPSLLAASDRPRKDIRKPRDLIEYAIYNDNLELLNFLLTLGEDYSDAVTVPHDKGVTCSFSLPYSNFKYAIQMDHCALVAEIIRRTGAGIPLSYLAANFGDGPKEKPNYYQGLSVYGRKRKDWARAANKRDNQFSYRRQRGGQCGPDHGPPLLACAQFASLDLLEWFLSDGPMKCYMVYAESHQENKYLRRLDLSESKFEGVVQNYLEYCSHLTMHMCIIGESTAESNKVLRYLIQISPQAMEAKSVDGLTPLQIAFQLYREDAAKLLIEAGADMTCRDREGRNLLHSLLTGQFSSEEDFEKVRRMLNLIDERLLPSMFIERASGSVTPLHYWLLHNKNRCQSIDIGVMEIMLEYSKGCELSLINGEGDSPLHYAVKKKSFEVAQLILDHDPSLIHRENGTGRTPFEMAEDAALAEVFSEPPPLPDNYGDFTSRKARRDGLHELWAEEVVSRPPETFVLDSKTVQKDDRDRVWEMLQNIKADIDAEGVVKRRLVTLNEANEIARRLAIAKSSKRSRGHTEDSGMRDNDEDEEGATDEVGLSMILAKTPFSWHRLPRRLPVRLPRIDRRKASVFAHVA